MKINFYFFSQKSSKKCGKAFETKRKFFGVFPCIYRHFWRLWKAFNFQMLSRVHEGLQERHFALPQSFWSSEKIRWEFFCCWTESKASQNQRAKFCFSKYQWIYIPYFKYYIMQVFLMCTGWNIKVNFITIGRVSSELPTSCKLSVSNEKTRFINWNVLYDCD